MAYGLYEVVPGRIYQVRGYDLANISFIKGDTGWIIYDPLTAAETSRAALEFINEKLGPRPVVGVVYSHSHGDHFGGVRGVVDEADVASGKVMLIAAEGFMEAAISENVFAGNAMNRRMQWQYAVLLQRDPHGHVDQAIGKNVAAGSPGLIAPNRLISKDFEEITLDGVTMVFQNAPDTEAPVQMNTYFPQFKAFWAAEVVTGTIHNIYTTRGAAVRNALNWSKEINEALYKFGGEAEVMFASHSWPRWGNERIQEVMRTQRDAYANLNNQTLHYVNQGVTINEIQNVYEVPKVAAAELGGAQLPRRRAEQRARRRQPLHRALRRQPDQPDPAVARRIGAALRRDDGRLGQDHRQGQGTGRAGQVPAGHRDPQQAGVRRAEEPGGAPAAGRRLRAAWLPGREHQRAQHASCRARSSCATACPAACRSDPPSQTSCGRCRPSNGSTSSPSAWTRRRPRG